MTETPAITRDQAREAIMRAEEVVKTAQAALAHAPYGAAHRAIKALDSLPESIACELGVEVIGHCNIAETLNANAATN